jgi:hypothetical protein
MLFALLAHLLNGEMKGPLNQKTGIPSAVLYQSVDGRAELEGGVHCSDTPWGISLLWSTPIDTVALPLVDGTGAQIKG